ncbi:MAG: protein O-mannosyl-transferase family [Anaerolineales bacterium]
MLGERISPDRRRLWLCRAVLWLGFLLLYALTTARGILAADSGEFQLAAAGWGILHPPGYPLYTVMGALWVRLLPLGSLPFRLNLMSAFLAATTLLLVFEVVRRWVTGWGAATTAAWAGGLAAALLLGTAPTFWAQATIANIRMPTLLFAAWGFLALTEYRSRLRAAPESAALPLSLGLALGLGVGHHPSLVFLATGWALYLLLLDPSILWQPRRWWKTALVTVLAWTLPQLYLPLRGGMANVPLSPGGQNTWEGFWYHVLARGFAGDMFAFSSPQDLALRLPLLGTLFRLQFPPLYLLLAFLAWIRLALRRTRLALALATSWAVHTFVTITYRAPQTVEYLMPAYLPVVIAFGLGLAATVEAWFVAPKSARKTPLLLSRPVTYFVFAFLLARLFFHYPDFALLARDRSVRERVAPLLEEAPEGALVLADWRWATPLWVLQEVEGLGAGVEVAYVYDDAWEAWVEGAGGRPLFSTHHFDWPEWSFAPVGGGYRLYRRPLGELPPSLGYLPLEADLGPVRLLGYRIEGESQPGEVLEVQLAWQATGVQEPPPSFTMRLFTPEGGFVTQSDLFLGGDTAEGEVRFANFPLLLPLDTCPGAVQPSVGLYTVLDGAFNNLGEVALPALPVACDLPVLPAMRLHPGVVTGGGPFLKGVDYDVQQGGASLYLHWCGPGRALVVSAGGTTKFVDRLWPGDCRSVRLPLNPEEGQPPVLELTRPTGEAVTLVTRPLPVPSLSDTYVPFSNELVLVGVQTTTRGDLYVANLTWRSLQPLVDDYAVSVRLKAEDGAELGIHDMQPALSALPTLKWVIGGLEILDPHPFLPPDRLPAWTEVAVYERFRLHRLPTPDSPSATVFLP